MSTILYDFLSTHAGKSTISFHMPGHKGSHLYKMLGYGEFLYDFLDMDITEISGADNLFQAEGILKDVQNAYARLYEVPYSYMLINGSSGGIIASILACVPKGKKLLMARNCHKSAFNALILGDIRPVYIYPEVLDGWGISGAISPNEIEKYLSADADIEAVLIPSPNYYGICSDIAAIAEILHRYGKILIVDQAHGAHLKFFSKWLCKNADKSISTDPTSDFISSYPAADLNFPKPAEEQGADIVINSVHKTLASMTQSALLNLNSDRIDRYLLEDKLQCIQSTSPSYILMASLDINQQLLNDHGIKLFSDWALNLKSFYLEAQRINGLNIMTNAHIPGLDPTKINLDFSQLGLSGAKLEKLLLEDDIFIELYTGNIIMCMTGIGNINADYTRLLKALLRISNNRFYDFKSNVKTLDIQKPKTEKIKQAKTARTNMSLNSANAHNISDILRTKLADIPKNKRRIKLTDAAGCVSAACIIPYPPGIPLVCPGEIITQEIIEHVKLLREHGEKVIGINDLGEIVAGDLEDLNRK